MNENDKKYIAIKLKSCPHWLYFSREEVTEKDGRFYGRNGWGSNGEAISVDINSHLIEGRMDTDVLMYR